MPSRHRVASLLALALLAACSTARGPGQASQPEPAPTTVEVTNNNWLDMVVYAQRSSMRVRLGMVTSMNTVRFALPATYAGPSQDVQLVAEPIGARYRFTSPTLYLSPGQRVELTLQNHLATSSISVW